MFSRSKSRKTKDKALKRAKKARGEATKKAREGRKEASKRAKSTQGKGGKRAKQASGAAADATSRAGDNLAQTASSALHAVSDAVSPRAEAAADTVRDRTANARERAAASAATTRDKAMAGLDKGVNAAVPRAQKGVASVGPKVDQARDTIVDDLLPRLQEMLGSVQGSKDDVLSRQDGPVAVVTGAPKKQRRKGGVLIAVGLLAAVGAAVAYFLSQKSDSDDTDPWAGSADRPTGGAPGVDSQVRESVTTPAPSQKEDTMAHDSDDTSTADTPTEGAHDSADTSTDGARDSDGAPSAAHDSGGTTTADGDRAGLDSEATDTVSDATPTTDTGLSSDDEAEVRMIDIDDVPGTGDDAPTADDDEQEKPQS